MSILTILIKIIIFTLLIPIYILKITIHFLTKERNITRLQNTLISINNDYVAPRVNTAKQAGIDYIHTLKANK